MASKLPVCLVKQNKKQNYYYGYISDIGLIYIICTELKNREINEMNGLKPEYFSEELKMLNTYIKTTNCP